MSSDEEFCKFLTLRDALSPLDVPVCFDLVVIMKPGLSSLILVSMHDGRYKRGLCFHVEFPGTTSTLTGGSLRKVRLLFGATRVELRRQDVNVGVLHPCLH